MKKSYTLLDVPLQIYSFFHVLFVWVAVVDFVSFSFLKCSDAFVGSNGVDDDPEA